MEEENKIKNPNDFKCDTLQNSQRPLWGTQNEAKHQVKCPSIPKIQ